ncbi:MAG: hypothetical protein FWF25_03715, partial [Propionibacteriaceae bacterium]|nr:hypothetical protein [Propionibacteriaceae bacterium]
MKTASDHLFVEAVNGEHVVVPNFQDFSPNYFITNSTHNNWVVAESVAPPSSLDERGRTCRAATPDFVTDSKNLETLTVDATLERCGTGFS